MSRVEINELVFKKVISAVKHSIARDDSRPILKYIQIKVSGNNFTAISLDGYRASRITVDLGNCNYEPFTCFIKPITIKPTKRGTFPVVIELDGDTAHVEVVTEYGKLKYSFTQPKEAYVDVDKIYEDAKEHDREVAINAVYLCEALKSCATVTLDRNNLTIIENKPDRTRPVIVRSKCEGILNEQLILPIRVCEEV